MLTTLTTSSVDIVDAIIGVTTNMGCVRSKFCLKDSLKGGERQIQQPLAPSSSPYKYRAQKHPIVSEVMLTSRISLFKQG